MLAPKYLRNGLNKQPEIKAKIGYFHHTPFPGAKIFEETLGNEKAKEIVSSLLKSDLIGFHVPSYVNNFMDTIEKLNLPEVKHIDKENNVITYQEHGQKPRQVKVKDFPIGMDYKNEHKEAGRPEVKEQMQELQEEFLNNNKDHKYLVFGIERADYTKNLVTRAKAIRKFLDTTPKDFHKKFTFVIAAPPSRLDIKSFADNYKALKKEIGDINNRYEENEGYTPIIFRENGVRGDERLAMFRLANALVVNPISDGMNLVGKEINAYKQEEDPLYKIILSKTPGLAQDPDFIANSVFIDDVLSVDDTAKAMKQAFQEIQYEPEKLKQENKILADSVRTRDVKWWSNQYMTELNKGR